MTRRDYEILARVIRSSEAVELAHVSTTETTRRELALEFAGALAADNPRFNRARFVAAATGERTDSAA